MRVEFHACPLGVCPSLNGMRASLSVADVQAWVADNTPPWKLRTELIVSLVGEMANSESEKNGVISCALRSRQRSSALARISAQHGFDAIQELRYTGNPQAVEDHVASLLILDDPRGFQQAQVLRDSRDIGTNHFGQVTNAPFPTTGQLIHDEQPRGMGHGLHDSCPSVIFRLRLGVHCLYLSG
jgi:hypothetical protein